MTLLHDDAIRFLQQVIIKKSEKLAKIAKIDEENFHIF